MTKDVHTEHCCSRHGCKYGSEYCPVESGDKPQSFMCEHCHFEIFEDGGWEDAHQFNVLFDRLRWAHAEDLWRIYLASCTCEVNYGTDCECESGSLAASALERLLGPVVWHTVMLKRIG